MSGLSIARQRNAGSGGGHECPGSDVTQCGNASGNTAPREVYRAEDAYAELNGV